MKILPANSPKRGRTRKRASRRARATSSGGGSFAHATTEVRGAIRLAVSRRAAKVAKRLGFGIGRLARAVAACAEIDPEAIERAAEARQRPELPGAPPFPSFSRPGPGPPPARFALLYTSGHNSAAAFHTALLQRRRCCVVVPFSSSTAATTEHTVGARHSADLVPDPDEPHTANLRAAAERFADATGLPLWNHGVPGYTSRTRFLKSEREAASAMATAMVRLRRDYGVLGVVVGHARDLSALLAAEAAAEVAGLRCIAPCWGAPRASELLLSCRGGAESMLVVRAAPHALGAVLRDPAEVRALADQMGGEDAVDGDAPGAPLDMIPCEAAFYGRSRGGARGREGGGGEERGRRRWCGKTYPSSMHRDRPRASATSSDARGTSHRPRTKTKSDDQTPQSSNRAPGGWIVIHERSVLRAPHPSRGTRERVRDGFRFVPVYPVRGVRVAHHLRAARRE